jgi:hypothetical protein
MTKPRDLQIYHTDVCTTFLLQFLFKFGCGPRGSAITGTVLNGSLFPEISKDEVSPLVILISRAQTQGWKEIYSGSTTVLSLSLSNCTFFIVPYSISDQYVLPIISFCCILHFTTFPQRQRIFCPFSGPSIMLNRNVNKQLWFSYTQIPQRAIVTQYFSCLTLLQKKCGLLK